MTHANESGYSEGRKHSLKPNELRIGNLVEYNGKHYKMLVIAVDVPFLDTIEFGDGVVEWHDLKPIPLTEEWLIKFGFDEIEMSIPVAYKTKSGFRIKEDQRGYWMQYKYGTVIIKHAHQLQNIFYSLCGSELAI
jgi:hypothetical protein